MALSIKNAEAESLARDLAKATGEGLTEAITVALQERLARVRSRKRVDADAAAIADIAEQFRRMPDVDRRSLSKIADESSTTTTACPSDRRRRYLGARFAARR